MIRDEAHGINVFLRAACRDDDLFVFEYAAATQCVANVTQQLRRLNHASFTDETARHATFGGTHKNNSALAQNFFVGLRSRMSIHATIHRRSDQDRATGGECGY